ncbi:MAG: glutamine-synthetase adenylyltransferase, partial [Pseudomonadota bacterium]
LLLELIAAAPRLADYLGREPQALDALLAQDFFEPMPDATGQHAVLETSLADAMHYEDALDLVRRFAREQGFRAGVQVLRGLAAPEEAGAAFSGVAEAALRALLPRVVEDFGYRHGPPPGRGLAVVALGKLGTREMTAGSDLDLVILYDAPLDAVSEGRRPLPAQTYYPRLTKALLAALTAPTSEGRLYEVDMRLRPSGRQGPVAVSLDAFRRYHAEAAWVWEHLALTRARVVAAAGQEGDTGALAATVSTLLDEVLARRKDDASVGEAASEMRKKLAEAHRTERDAPWSLKHTAGGLMEVEFATQTGVLICGLPRADRAGQQLPRLAEAGWLTAAEAEAMASALDLTVRLQQLERVALSDATPPERFGPCLSAALARAVGTPDFERLSDFLAERQKEAAAAVEARFARLQG